MLSIAVQIYSRLEAILAFNLDTALPEAPLDHKWLGKPGHQEKSSLRLLPETTERLEHDDEQQNAPSQSAGVQDAL